MFAFFKRIFTSTGMATKSQSKVLRWAEAQKASNENLPPIKLLSDATIYAITRFVVQPERKNDAVGKMATNTMLTFSNDASLFELGCYVYFRIDLWHVQNKYNEFREKVLNFCLDEFISVFEDALGFDYANEILQNRLDLYGKLIREGNVERIDFYLVQLLLRTKNDVLPEVHNFDDFPVVVTGFFEESFLKIALKAFDAGILPAILQNFKHIYESKSVKSHRTNTRIDQQIRKLMTALLAGIGDRNEQINKLEALTRKQLTDEFERALGKDESSVDKHIKAKKIDEIVSASLGELLKDIEDARQDL